MPLFVFLFAKANISHKFLYKDLYCMLVILSKFDECLKIQFMQYTGAQLELNRGQKDGKHGYIGKSSFSSQERFSCRKAHLMYHVLNMIVWEETSLDVVCLGVPYLGAWGIFFLRSNVLSTNSL